MNILFTALFTGYPPSFIAFPCFFAEVFKTLCITSMVSNYYTLLHVARNLDKRLSGKRLHAAFSQNKNELVIHCEGDLFVLANCEPHANSIFLKTLFSRTKKNSVGFFETLHGQTIDGVDINPSDREVIFRFPAHRVIAQLFGSKANVLLVDNKNAILESFLKPKDFVGKNYTSRERKEIQSAEALYEQLKQFRGDTLLSAVKKSFTQLGAGLVREVLVRARLASDQKTTDVTPADASALYVSYESLLREVLTNPSPIVYFDGEQARAFCIVPLKEFQGLSPKSFESIHDALRMFISRSHRDQNLADEKGLLVHRLSQEVERARRTLGKMDNETEALERAESYERHGKVILANLADLKKGMKSVTLSDPADGPVSLLLDPSLTPARNAEKYFDKSKKARASIAEAAGYRKELQRKLAFAQDLLEKLEGIESPEAFGEFAGQNVEPLSTLGIKLDKRGKSVEDKIPFRVFTVAGGFQVWAGKSGENNDLLTLKHAKPNDFWFHARGSGGSHVVLKVGTGKGEPSRQAMEQAAAIAAYYSKMKNSRMVPVAMTQKKYVRKPRGVPAGTVTIEREKVFFVEPRLPQQEEGK